jgi:hypothetical protein
VKPGASILSFLFIVLSIQPAFINWNNMNCIKQPVSQSKGKSSPCCKKTCSDDKALASKKPVKQQSKDPVGGCNPFMSCNACPYIPAESQTITSPEQPVGGEITNGLNNGNLSDYNQDFWHPPELFFHL